MIELIKTATGRPHSRFNEKPYHYMIDVITARTGYKREEIAMVGDRLSTDIALNSITVLSILVLTGEAT